MRTRSAANLYARLSHRASNANVEIASNYGMSEWPRSSPSGLIDQDLYHLYGFNAKDLPKSSVEDAVTDQSPATEKRAMHGGGPILPCPRSEPSSALVDTGIHDPAAWIFLVGTRLVTEQPAKAGFEGECV